MTADPRPASRIRAAFWKAVHQPFLQFLCLGGLIFLVAAVADSWRDRNTAEIVVDKHDMQRIAALYEAQMGTPPTPRQVDALVDTYIHDEILYREAKRMKLDDGDEIVKRRLVQKIEFLMARVDPSAEPSERELRRYYDDHKDSFVRPGTVDFVHVYFSPDEAGNASAEQRAKMALAGLGNDDAKTAGLGDPFPLQGTYVGLTKTNAIQLFGDTPIIDALFDTPTKTWVGPFRSGYGWHLIRITASKPAQAPPFEDVRENVLSALQQDRQDRASTEAYEAMKARYRIIRPEKVATQ